jgi:hypothetical protein
VRTTDASERALGYEPPIFVVIRFSRSVRAIGFRDRAFEQQLGHARYRGMRSTAADLRGPGAVSRSAIFSTARRAFEPGMA